MNELSNHAVSSDVASAVVSKTASDENDAVTAESMRGHSAKQNNIEKPVNKRGRGRPPKNAITTNYTATNYTDVKARGRPPKGGKLKITEPIIATGRGRGRPKASPASDSDSSESSDDSTSDSDEEPKQSNAKKVKRGPGRPKKPKELDPDSDDEEERRPVGRPATGAINLNIERTGRGQGRPKKNSRKASLIAAAVAKNASENGNCIKSDTVTPKRRGRPPSGKPKFVPTGKPRGRPKKIKNIYHENGTEVEIEQNHNDIDNKVGETVVNDTKTSPSSESRDVQGAVKEGISGSDIADLCVESDEKKCCVGNDENKNGNKCKEVDMITKI